MRCGIFWELAFVISRQKSFSSIEYVVVTQRLSGVWFFSGLRLYLSWETFRLKFQASVMTSEGHPLDPGKVQSFSVFSCRNSSSSVPDPLVHRHHTVRISNASDDVRHRDVYVGLMYRVSYQC